MDTNRFKKDGFSNPDTERDFEQWPEERWEKAEREHTMCALCQYKRFLNSLWVICLNPDSRYCYETLFVCFTCPVQAPWPDCKGPAEA